MKKFLMAALALLTSVLDVQAQGYQDYRAHNYGSRRDYSMYANRYDRFGIDGVYMGIRIGPSFTTVDSDDKALDGGNTQTGLNLGVFGGMQLSPKAPVFIESGLMYVEKGGKNLYEGKKVTYSLHYLEIPIVVKYAIQLNEHFSVQPFAGGTLRSAWAARLRTSATARCPTPSHTTTSSASTPVCASVAA